MDDDKVGTHFKYLNLEMEPTPCDFYDPGTSENGIEHSVTKIWSSTFSFSGVRRRGGYFTIRRSHLPVSLSSNGKRGKGPGFGTEFIKTDPLLV